MVLKTLQGGWPQTPLSDVGLAVYWEELKDFDYGDVLIVVRELMHGGREFMPPVGVIYKRLIDDELGAPQWPVVHKWLRRYNATGFHQIGDEVPGRREAVREVKAQMPPLVADFISEVGGRYVYEALDSGGNGEARVRTQWEAYVTSRVQQRIRRGLPQPALRALPVPSGE